MHNTLIAVLVKKGVLTKDEGEKLVEYINNKPQSSVLADAIEQIGEFLSDDIPKLAHEAQHKAKEVMAGAEKLAEKAVQTAKKEAGKVAGEAKELAAEAKDEAEKAVDLASEDKPAADKPKTEKATKK